MATTHEEIIPTRRSLLNRLKDWEDMTSWKDFFDTYWSLIYGVARKAGLSDSEAQDVVQETIISVARKIPEFTYDPAVCSFKTWLMKMTRWRIIDQIRKKQYERDGHRYPREESWSDALLENHSDLAGFDLEAVWNEEWEKHLLQTALDKVKQYTNPKQFQMFYLHVIKSMAAGKVAQLLGVKLAAVYFAKYKVSAEVRKQIRALQDKML
jgi:RNA polymerase sigma factor (sigma-70 family)